MFEHYLVQGDKKLRLGFTTGSAATLAAKAALQELLTGEISHEVAITTPKGLVVQVEPERQDHLPAISYGVRKDGGDDIDATDGALIVATVERQAEGITIEGGDGVGRVTKAGLSLPVGSAAINPVPRQMLEEMAWAMTEGQGGIKITISVPEGEHLAEKTFNPQLGIVGGISIIGTTGIVEPRSNRALIETVRLELGVRRAEGHACIILTPGNMGEAYAKGLTPTKLPIVSYSNYLGECLDRVTELKFSQVFIVGHIGKLSKVAAGIMNTHSRQADGRREVFCAHAALAGIEREKLAQIMEAATTDAMIEIIQAEPQFQAVMQSILASALKQMKRRLPHTTVELLCFYTGGYVATQGFIESWNDNAS